MPPGQEAAQALRLGIDLSGESWAAALTHIGGEVRDTMASLSVLRLLEEQLSGCRTFFYNDAAALIAPLTQEFTIYALIQALDRVCSLAESYLGLTLTIGVGAPCGQIAGLVHSAAGARSALDYRTFVGRGRAIYIGDLEPDCGGRLAFDEADERALSSAVKLGGEDEVRAAVEALTEKVRTSNPAPGQYNLFFLELLTCLLKLTRRADLRLEDVFGEHFTGALQATDFPSVEAMGQWCLERCLRIQTLIHRQRTDSADRTVELAKDFIHQNYGDSGLSVERLCAYLHLSPAYFSTLFKRETGMSFTAYVTVERMEAAAEALRGTEDKTYLIARRCGYEDPNYFSYVFKRHFGVTPTKFRAG